MTQINRPSILIIFLTVFIDLIGFGIIIPLNPYLATHYGASPLLVGLLMSIYSFMQFLCAPFWGQLSDRYGRKPIILISLCGSCLSYVGFAFAQSLTLLFVARMFAGACGANISTAMAYMADVTTQHDRSKGMGLIGAAFGLGFIVGPFLGGIFGHWGSLLGSLPPFGMQFSAAFAAVLCLGNFLFALHFLVESFPTERRALGVARESKSRLKTLVMHVSRPRIGRLVSVFFLMSFAMAHMEATLFLYVNDKFQWDLKTSSYGFAYIGLVMAFTQGVLIRKWVPVLGEKILLFLGLSLASCGLWGVGFSDSITALAVSMTLFALGHGLSNPSLLGCISVLTDPSQQGEIMGVTHSLAALARIAGPILGGYFYGRFFHEMPFWVGGSLGLVAILLTLSLFRVLPQK